MASRTTNRDTCSILHTNAPLSKKDLITVKKELGCTSDEAIQSVAIAFFLAFGERHCTTVSQLIQRDLKVLYNPYIMEGRLAHAIISTLYNNPHGMSEVDSNELIQDTLKQIPFTAVEKPSEWIDAHIKRAIRSLPAPVHQGRLLKFPPEAMAECEKMEAEHRSLALKLYRKCECTSTELLQLYNTAAFFAHTTGANPLTDPPKNRDMWVSWGELIRVYSRDDDRLALFPLQHYASELDLELPFNPPDDSSNHPFHEFVVTMTITACEHAIKCPLPHDLIRPSIYLDETLRKDLSFYVAYLPRFVDEPIDEPEEGVSRDRLDLYMSFRILYNLIHLRILREHRQQAGMASVARWVFSRGSDRVHGLNAEQPIRPETIEPELRFIPNVLAPQIQRLRPLYEKNGEEFDQHAFSIFLVNIAEPLVDCILEVNALPYVEIETKQILDATHFDGGRNYDDFSRFWKDLAGRVPNNLVGTSTGFFQIIIDKAAHYEEWPEAMSQFNEALCIHESDEVSTDTYFKALHYFLKKEIPEGHLKLMQSQQLIPQGWGYYSMCIIGPGETSTRILQTHQKLPLVLAVQEGTPLQKLFPINPAVIKSLSNIMSGENGDWEMWSEQLEALKELFSKGSEGVAINLYVQLIELFITGKASPGHWELFELHQEVLGEINVNAKINTMIEAARDIPDSAEIAVAASSSMDVPPEFFELLKSPPIRDCKKRVACFQDAFAPIDWTSINTKLYFDALKHFLMGTIRIEHLELLKLHILAPEGWTVHGNNISKIPSAAAAPSSSRWLSTNEQLDLVLRAVTDYTSSAPGSSERSAITLALFDILDDDERDYDKQNERLEEFHSAFDFLGEEECSFPLYLNILHLFLSGKVTPGHLELLDIERLISSNKQVKLEYFVMPAKVITTPSGSDRSQRTWLSINKKFDIIISAIRGGGMAIEEETPKLSGPIKLLANMLKDDSIDFNGSSKKIEAFQTALFPQGNSGEFNFPLYLYMLHRFLLGEICEGHLSIFKFLKEDSDTRYSVDDRLRLVCEATLKESPAHFFSRNMETEPHLHPVSSIPPELVGILENTQIDFTNWQKRMEMFSEILEPESHATMDPHVFFSYLHLFLKGKIFEGHFCMLNLYEEDEDLTINERLDLISRATTPGVHPGQNDPIKTFRALALISPSKVDNIKRFLQLYAEKFPDEADIKSQQKVLYALPLSLLPNEFKDAYVHQVMNHLQNLNHYAFTKDQYLHLFYEFLSLQEKPEVLYANIEVVQMMERFIGHQLDSTNVYAYLYYHPDLITPDPGLERPSIDGILTTLKKARSQLIDKENLDAPIVNHEVMGSIVESIMTFQFALIDSQRQQELAAAHEQINEVIGYFQYLAFKSVAFPNTEHLVHGFPRYIPTIERPSAEATSTPLMFDAHSPHETVTPLFQEHKLHRDFYSTWETDEAGVHYLFSLIGDIHTVSGSVTLEIGADTLRETPSLMSTLKDLCYFLCRDTCLEPIKSEFFLTSNSNAERVWDAWTHPNKEAFAPAMTKFVQDLRIAHRRAILTLALNKELKTGRVSPPRIDRRHLPYKAALGNLFLINSSYALLPQKLLDPKAALCSSSPRDPSSPRQLSYATTSSGHCGTAVSGRKIWFSSTKELEQVSLIWNAISERSHHKSSFKVNCPLTKDGFSETVIPIKIDIENREVKENYEVVILESSPNAAVGSSEPKPLCISEQPDIFQFRGIKFSMETIYNDEVISLTVTYNEDQMANEDSFRHWMSWQFALLKSRVYKPISQQLMREK